MLMGRVVGQLVATVKDEGLEGYPLLLVDLVDAHGRSKGKAPQIAIDRIGVGPGELVLLKQSKEAGLGLPRELVPADLGIVGKVESVTLLDSV